MKRTEAISLLKNLVKECESMRLAPIVSLVSSANPEDWKLIVKWSISEEKGCFEKIITGLGLQAIETKDGYTIFQNL